MSYSLVSSETYLDGTWPFLLLSGCSGQLFGPCLVLLSHVLTHLYL